MDIVVEVLEVAKNGVNKTAIVYRTNLNFKLADKYLVLLENQGLLVNESDKYITTNKGKTFLEQAKQLTFQLETPLRNPNEMIPKLEMPVQKHEEIVKQIEVQMIQSREMLSWLEVSMTKPKERNLNLEVPILTL